MKVLDGVIANPVTPVEEGPSNSIPPKERAVELKAPHAPVSSPTTDEPTDPVRFLMKHRHLDGKRVSVSTPNGAVTGTVRGLVTPNILVSTDNGYEIQVPPKDIKVV